MPEQKTHAKAKISFTVQNNQNTFLQTTSKRVKLAVMTQALYTVSLIKILHLGWGCTSVG